MDKKNTHLFFPIHSLHREGVFVDRVFPTCAPLRSTKNSLISPFAFPFVRAELAGSSYSSSAFGGAPTSAQAGGAQSPLDYTGYGGYGPQGYPYYAQGYGYVQAAAAAAAGAVASPLAPSTYQLAQLPPVAAQQHGESGRQPPNLAICVIVFINKFRLQKKNNNGKQMLRCTLRKNVHLVSPKGSVVFERNHH